MIISTFEHVYIVTQWYLIDFSEMNDNGNVLFEILLLSDKLLVLSNMEIAFAADNTAVKQNVAGLNIPLSILSKFFMMKLRFLSFSRSRLIDF